MIQIILKTNDQEISIKEYNPESIELCHFIDAMIKPLLKAYGYRTDVVEKFFENKKEK